MSTTARLVQVLQFVRRSIGQPAAIAGALSGLWIVCAGNAWIAHLGANGMATAIGWLALCAGISSGLRSTPRPSRRRSSLTAIALALVTAGFPLVLKGALLASRLWTVPVLANAWGQFSYLLWAASFAWLIPCWCLGAISAEAIGQSEVQRGRSSALRALLLGAAGGGAATVLLAGSGWDLHVLMMIATAVLSASRLAAWIDARRHSLSIPATATPTESPDPHHFSLGIPFWLRVGCLGLQAGVLHRMAEQLWIGVEPLAHAVWVSLCLGAAMGMGRAIRRPSVEGAAGSLLTASVWSVAVLAAFPLLVQLVLMMNASITWGGLHGFARVAVLLALFAPFGSAIGSLIATARCPEPQDLKPIASAEAMAGGLMAAVAGFLLAAPLIGSPLGFRATASLAILLPSLLAAASLRRHWNGMRRWTRAVAACGLAAAVVAPLASGRYRPETSARLLFNTQVLVAYQNGVERRLLPFLDESRLIAKRETSRGVLTLWQSRGAQMHLRENGVPRGHLSAATAIFPHYGGELALAAAPMTLHAAPHRVLLLGAGGGLPMLTSLAFPVKTVECVEPNSALVSLLAEKAWPKEKASPLADERLTVRTLSPALALAADRREWDVILSNPPQPAAAAAAAEFTLEFYQAAANRLEADGIFCQRFVHIDFGPVALLTAARTMQSAFREVIALEAAGGEMLLIATNSEKGVVRDGLVDRLQAGHVRRVLSQAGWDWPVPLSLTAYDGATLRQLAQRERVNTAASGRLAFGLPRELLRWSNKFQETAALMGNKATKLIAWPNIDGNDPDLLARMSEVAGQRNLMTAFPDQPWAYRKSLKEQLASSKKSIIRQVSGSSADRDLHPVDQQRKDYFEVLGLCLRQPDPDLKDLERLQSLTTPYDPLLSYFAHYELAELHARKPEADRTTELELRLHLAWYADPRDQSVRQIVQSLELLTGDSVQVDAATRWDQMNGLLQLLLLHWENRSTGKPGANEVVLKDLERSISTAEAALEAMQTLAPEVGQAESDWNARRSVLERALVRPLRTYRARLLPLVFKDELRTKRELEKAGVLPGPSQPAPAVDPLLGL